MRVHVVDPSAYTPPYDHALCGALAAAGAEVELFTSRFAHGTAPSPTGYARRYAFYRLGARVRDERARRAVKLAEHVPDMLRYRRAARTADVVHFQWLAVQQLDGRLLPSRTRPDGRRRALVLTAHDVLPREGSRAQRRAQQRLYGRFDAVVVHSEHGRRRLTGELGVPAERVHVIPHGALAHLSNDGADGAGAQHADARHTDARHTDADDSDALARLGLPATGGPVVLFFGLLRPYKGLDVLLEAWRGVDGAELWVVGAPRMDIGSLRAAAGANVRFVTRFVEDAELAACFRRARLVVLPYREIDQSGVLFTALAFAKPLLLSDVGGFPEIASAGAARTFPSGDAAALREALRALLHDDDARARMAARARELASGEYSWAAVAARTLALYESLLDDDRGSSSDGSGGGDTLGGTP